MTVDGVAVARDTLAGPGLVLQVGKRRWLRLVADA
jgi:hypothetical protein